MTNKFKIATLCFLLGSLVSCSSNKYEPNNKLICPAGAPAFAFYDQGNNELFKTDNKDNVKNALLTNEFDYVVFDVLNSLKIIKKNNASFKLASLITGGNFFIVSYNKNPNDVPTSNDRFVSFGEGNLPDLVFKKLLSDYASWNNWNIDLSKITYLSETSDVSKALINKSYDYYFIAEPSLFAAKNQLGTDKSKVNEVANLKECWNGLTGQSAVPQAGLFVRNECYEANESNVNDYVSSLNQRKTTCIDNPLIAKQAMDAYESDLVKQSARFGFNSNVAYNVQKDNLNHLGIVKDEDVGDLKTFVNNFISELDNPSYTMFEDRYFL